MIDPLASTSESESAYADAVTESENTVCPAHQCGIPCSNCKVVRECDCSTYEGIDNALKQWQESQDANPFY